MTLDLRYAIEDLNDIGGIKVDFGLLDLRGQGHLGLSVYSEFTLQEGQAVTFVLRTPPKATSTPHRLGTPTPEQSAQSGVPLDGPLSESMYSARASNMVLTPEAPALLKGISQLRPKDDPLLNNKLLNSLLKVDERRILITQRVQTDI